MHNKSWQTKNLFSSCPEQFSILFFPIFQKRPPEVNWAVRSAQRLPLWLRAVCSQRPKLQNRGHVQHPLQAKLLHSHIQSFQPHPRGIRVSARQELLFYQHFVQAQPLSGPVTNSITVLAFSIWDLCKKKWGFTNTLSSFASVFLDCNLTCVSWPLQLVKHT